MYEEIGHGQGFAGANDSSDASVVHVALLLSSKLAMASIQQAIRACNYTSNFGGS